MVGEDRLPTRGRNYVACVVAAGSAAIAHAVYSLVTQPIGDAWLILAALTLFSGSFTVKVPSIPATISVSETFVFTAVLLFGTGPATLIVALDGLIITLWRKRRRLNRILFNATEPAVSIWVASTLFFAWTDFEPLVRNPAQSVLFARLAAPLLLLTATYFLLNSILTAVAVSYDTNTPASSLWKRHFLWLSVNYFGGASVALLLARNAPGLDPSSPGVVLSALSIILPLLVISYLTFRTAMGRIEDTTHHLTELNTLYLSVIEALATTIDARDQTTHGHIRRVQNQAIVLAKRLGVSDHRLLRAIEAAALLHDLGKLRVPERILNKPGRLTAAEFEKIKSHSSVGAEILSSIEFPYPVIPIVRHHHENWDGSGYPDAITGTDIPIGARILAVVDCYDALTSDRPYRRALSHEEACRILVERRGSMYDPVVADAFLATRLVPDTDPLTGPTLTTLGPAARTAVLTPAVVPDAGPAGSAGRAGDTGIQVRDNSVRQREDGLVWSDALVRVALAATSADCAVFFARDGGLDGLVAVSASGDQAESLVGLRLSTENTATGWSAVNRRVVLNSDPATDFTGSTKSLADVFRSAAFVPLPQEGTLIGVLTLYSRKRESLGVSARTFIRALAPGVVIEGDLPEDRSAADDRSRDLFCGRVGPSSVPAERPVVHSIDRATSLMLVSIRPNAANVESECVVSPAAFGNSLLTIIAASTRPEDTVVRISDREIAVLVPGTSSAQTAAIEDRVRMAIESVLSESNGDTSWSLRVGWSRQERVLCDLSSLIARARTESRPYPQYGGLKRNSRCSGSLDFD